MGFERHLPWHDAIHVGATCGLDPDLHIPAACTVAAEGNGRLGLKTLVYG